MLIRSREVGLEKSLIRTRASSTWLRKDLRARPCDPGRPGGYGHYELRRGQTKRDAKIEQCLHPFHAWTLRGASHHVHSAAVAMLAHPPPCREPRVRPEWFAVCIIHPTVICWCLHVPLDGISIN